MRLLKNKILMFNILSTIFYILGSSGYITFLSKYMEVQFNKNSADASIITGPITIIGMVTGFLLSGYVISKYRPGPRKLFFWNVLVGFGYMIGQLIYIFLSCDNNYINNFTGTLNLTAECNTNCSCSGVAYSPVCYEPTATTFFSPCHAACNRWDDSGKFYDNCACAAESHFTNLPLNYSTILQSTEIYKTQARTSPFSTESTSSSIFSSTVPVVSTSEDFTVSFVATESTVAVQSVTENQYEPILFKSIINTTDSSTDEELVSQQNSATDALDITDDKTGDDADDKTDDDTDDITTTTPSDYNNENVYSTTEEKLSRQERSSEDNTNYLLKMVPGACLAGCAKGFYMFTIISFIINWFGATGRIGNILLNFR